MRRSGVYIMHMGFGSAAEGGEGKGEVERS